MFTGKLPPRTSGGPFRLLKYFIISGFALIVAVTVILGALLYTSSVDTVLRSAGNYARLLAENLNYNIHVGFYAPLKARGVVMDLKKWDQFGTLDSLIKDFTYGLKIQRIKIVDSKRKIIYSTEYDLIGTYEPENRGVDEALHGKDLTVVRHEKTAAAGWYGRWLADTCYPLREVTGNYWMLGNIYGVIEITQDVSEQYGTVQRSIGVIILVAAGLMVFLFVTLTLIVRRGERILLEKAEERKRLEEQLQQSEKLASIGQMVATIAHEIRNPLGIIRSSAEMLARKTDPDPSRIQRLCGVIVEEATRLSSILTDFLEFARPRVPTPRTLDMREVIARVRTNLDQEIRARKVQWSERLVDGVRPVVSADPDQLYQAFLNIVMNAFEAMEDGGTLTITIEGDRSFVHVAVADSGHGIAEEDLPRIYTPFFTTHEMGTGLGLAVVHNIITAHHGRLDVESRPGQGTVFSVLLPATKNERTDTGE
jgi:two-component system, NtrC family, sensor histidine kinase HydH